MSFFSEIGALYGQYAPLLGGALCVFGAVLTLFGAIGVLRFPDFYTRLHAASVTDTGAVLALITGMCLMSPSGLVTYKLIIILIFLFLTSPTASHAVANAALKAGLTPILSKPDDKAQTAETDQDTAKEVTS